MKNVRPLNPKVRSRFAGALALAMLTITPADALAFDLFCKQRSAVGFWLGEASPIDVGSDGSGSVHFFFDTTTGDYVERKVGSRAAITDRGSYAIVHDEKQYGRDILAIKGNTTLHIHVGVERTAFMRVDRGASIEIGSCEPVDN